VCCGIVMHFSTSVDETGDCHIESKKTACANSQCLCGPMKLCLAYCRALRTVLASNINRTFESSYHADWMQQRDADGMTEIGG
jgi:hypothetical protein